MRRPARKYQHLRGCEKNNFNMIAPDPRGPSTSGGGTNDVASPGWEYEVAVAVSGQIGNATLFQLSVLRVPWAAHDVAIYRTRHLYVYSGCPAGSPGCGDGVPSPLRSARTRWLPLLFDWGGNNDIDRVNVWANNAVFGPVTHVYK